MEADLQSIFTQMYNDAEIIEEYSQIANNEAIGGGYAAHDLSHVNRVINNCGRIAKYLDMNSEDITTIKIAALLHDIGCVSGGKSGHDKRSAEWAKKYLQNKGMSKNACAKIITAISEHSDNAQSAYGKILLFFDKIDISEKRILPAGLLIVGNRQYGRTKSVEFSIESSALNVNFISNGQIDIAEMNEYYFTKKVFKGIAGLASHFGLGHRIAVDGEDVLKTATALSWE